jgi:hypothetical protein
VDRAERIVDVLLRVVPENGVAERRGQPLNVRFVGLLAKDLSPAIDAHLAGRDAELATLQLAGAEQRRVGVGIVVNLKTDRWPIGLVGVDRGSGIGDAEARVALQRQSLDDRAVTVVFDHRPAAVSAVPHQPRVIEAKRIILAFSNDASLAADAVEFATAKVGPVDGCFERIGPGWNEHPSRGIAKLTITVDGVVPKTHVFEIRLDRQRGVGDRADGVGRLVTPQDMAVVREFKIRLRRGFRTLDELASRRWGENPDQNEKH